MAKSTNAPFYGQKSPSSSHTTKLLTTSSDIELTEADAKATDQCGQLQTTYDFDIIGVLAVAITLSCFILAVLVVTPNLWLSWKLGFPGQIVFVGFLLSAMNLCMQTVLPTLFLRAEAKWGQSTLQNYDALLRNRFVVPNVNNGWRLVLVFLTILPLGLSVAYKRFLGGSSDVGISVPSFQNHTYGTAFPSLGDFATMTWSMFLMMHPVAGLQLAASNDQNFASVRYPAAYGYNVLLLNDSSAAMLDIPSSNYISEIQGQLRRNESWYMNATVGAYVAQYNQSITDLARGDSSYWNDTVAYNAANTLMQRNRLNAKYLYDPAKPISFGTYPLLPTNDESSTVFLGAFEADSTSGDLIDTYDPETQSADYTSFSQTAMAFSISRQTCSGRWTVDTTGIKLLAGHCSDPSSAGSRIRSPAIASPESLPFAIDTLPVLTFTTATFASNRADSPWAMPVLATSAACMYWSLAVNRLAGSNTTQSSDYGLLYPPINETVISSNSAMSTHWLLYLVLALQPVVTIAAFGATMLLNSSPVTRGFGLISILAGVNRPSLDILRGAESSGQLKRPVTLDIIRTENLVAGGEAQTTSQQVRYELYSNKGASLTRYNKLEKSTYTKENEAFSFVSLDSVQFNASTFITAAPGFSPFSIPSFAFLPCLFVSPF